MRGPVLVVLALCSVGLAGCGDDEVPAGEGRHGDDFDHMNGRGAIRGIVIDDRYRPVGGATVLLAPVGATATSDASGEFAFLDLVPGAYILKVQAEGHEAAPVSADVGVGQWTDVEVQARRVFSEGGAILTTQYSVFIDCAEEALVFANSGETLGVSCMMDQSGDSARGGFDTDLSGREANLTTWMVTEVLFNQKGTFGVVLGVVDATDTFVRYYAEADVHDGVYRRIQNQAKEANERDGENVQGRNAAWPPDKPFTTFIFPHGLLYKEMQEAAGLFGVGVVVGVKAKIVQSVFLGEPEVDVDAYAVLQPTGT